MERSSLDTCRFRHSVRRRGQAEEAVCGWLQAATGLRGVEPLPCRARRLPGVPGRRPSDAAVRQSGRGLDAVPDRRRDRRAGRGAGLLRGGRHSPQGTGRGHAGVLPGRALEPVGLRCGRLLRGLRASDRAGDPHALEQDGAIPIVHLIDDGGGGAPLIARYARHWNVVIHRNPAPRGLFATLHELLPELRTEFVAVQEAGTISHRDRLATSVAALVSGGWEILAAPLLTPAGTVRPREPGRTFRRDLPTATLVFRRAALLDMGGFADRPADADAELVHRAAREGRRILLAPEATVTALEAPSPAPLGLPPRYRRRGGLLDHHGAGSLAGRSNATSSCRSTATCPTSARPWRASWSRTRRRRSSI